MRLQLIAVQPHETLPVDVFGYRRGFIERWPALLVRHLEKEQKRQLLDIVAVRQPVVTQDVAVVPEFLNQLIRRVTHRRHRSNLTFFESVKFAFKGGN